MSRTAPTPPLHLPYPGAPAGEAITRFFRKYATFSGRASRAEYWWIILATLIVNAMISIAEAIEDSVDATSLEEIRRTAVKQLRMIIVGMAGWRSSD